MRLPDHCHIKDKETMLESISWNDFINALIVLTCVYYIVVVAMFYSADIIRSLQGRSRTTEAKIDTAPNRSSPVMGEIKSSDRDTGIQKIMDADDSEVLVSSTREGSDLETLWESAPLVTNPLHRSFAQLVEEINALAYIVSKNDKEEISLLFETLLARYPQLARPHYQASINQFIVEACQQHGTVSLSVADVEGWWQRALTEGH